ncbi:MAG: hypothetical protein ACRD47_16550, partial [Nitrososphaeraceae archaeon]
MNTLKDNSIGIASHSSRRIRIQENSFTDSQMAGKTSVNTLYSHFVVKMAYFLTLKVRIT